MSTLFKTDIYAIYSQSTMVQRRPIVCNVGKHEEPLASSVITAQAAGPSHLR